MIFFAHLSLIRVALLRVDPSIHLDVLKGIVHQASHAAHVSIVAGAVNQLLLTQRHQLASLLKVLTL